MGSNQDKKKDALSVLTVVGAIVSAVVTVIGAVTDAGSSVRDFKNSNKTDE